MEQAASRRLHGYSRLASDSNVEAPFRLRALGVCIARILSRDRVNAYG